MEICSSASTHSQIAERYSLEFTRSTQGVFHSCIASLDRTSVEEAHEAYSPHRPAEGFTEILEELEQFVLLFLLLLVSFLTFLPLRESFPSKVSPADEEAIC